MNFESICHGPPSQHRTQPENCEKAVKHLCGPAARDHGERLVHHHAFFSFLLPLPNSQPWWKTQDETAIWPWARWKSGRCCVWTKTWRKAHAYQVLHTPPTKTSVQKLRFPEDIFPNVMSPKRFAQRLILTQEVDLSKHTNDFERLFHRSQACEREFRSSGAT